MDNYIILVINLKYNRRCINVILLRDKHNIKS